MGITGDISKGKTRILVTHHVHILSRCDTVIVMEGGTIKHQGTYQDLIDQGVDFAGAVDVSKVQNDEDGEAGKEAENEADDESGALNNKSDRSLKQSEGDGSGKG